jgi:16S rRNA (guanine(966)-N(2))-methyltransferase RsmD
MRIVAGKFRSRQLKSVGKLDLRPTSDRLRETLFNVLAADVKGSVFIDCFAGTGAVGIEALSRGARRVIFVEKHPPTAALIFANLKSLGVDPETSFGDGTAGTEILTTNAGKGLLRLAGQNMRADILFADPPYAEIGMCVKALERATASEISGKLLGENSTIIIEHATRSALPETIGQFRRTRILKQGDSTLSFYR